MCSMTGLLLASPGGISTPAQTPSGSHTPRQMKQVTLELHGSTSQRGMQLCTVCKEKLCADHLLYEVHV